LNENRRINAAKLTSIIERFSAYLSTLTISSDIVPGYYGFPLYLKPNDRVSRNEFCKRLESYSIETRPNMGGCLPDQPGFVGRNHRVVGELRNARSIRDNALFIGVHSELNRDNFENFEKALEDIFE
jgi:CDP-6-deoxy-D-xylo-4-hexulose-3-dehydrase